MGLLKRKKKKVKENPDDKLKSAVDQLISTIEWHGVKLVKAELDESPPHIYINLYKVNLKKSTNETLNLVYWSFWTLIYGKYSKKKFKKHKLKIDYEVIV